MIAYEEKASQDHDMAFSVLATTPRPEGIRIVCVKNTATGGSGRFEQLDFYPLGNATARTDFYQTAGVTQDQEWYTITLDEGTYTIVTYPYSFASPTLTYAVTYEKVVATIASGADADAAMVWPSQLDFFFTHLAELTIAHELKNDTMLQRLVAILDLEKSIVEQHYGVSLSALKLPPVRDLQPVLVRAPGTS